MKLSNKQYDTVKWVITIALPASATLVTALGAVYGWDTKVIVGTITAVTTFLGTLTAISTASYNKEDK